MLGEGGYIALELGQDPLASIAEVVDLDAIRGTGGNIDYFLERWVLQHLERLRSVELWSQCRLRTCSVKLRRTISGRWRSANDEQPR